MKKVIVAMVILVAIVVAGILEAVYIDKTFDNVQTQLDGITEQVKTEDEQALKTTSEFFDWWEKKRSHIELFAYSPDLRSFSIALAETKGSIECGDYANALSKCESLKVMAENIHKVLDFNGLDII
ncbi:MAG: DUF4363 family protein [Clostridia bacterium]|nr:DUF4363 family protein [Clostridia bacterium]